MNHMEQLVKNLLNGSSDTITVPIELKVPRALYQTYQLVAEKLGMPVQRALENLANQGIESALKNVVILKGDIIEDGRSKPGITDLAKANGLDLSSLTAGLERLNQVINQMSNLQETITNAVAEPTNSPGESK